MIERQREILRRMTPEGNRERFEENGFMIANYPIGEGIDPSLMMGVNGRQIIFLGPAGVLLHPVEVDGMEIGEFFEFDPRKLLVLTEAHLPGEKMEAERRWHDAGWNVVQTQHEGKVVAYMKRKEGNRPL